MDESFIVLKPDNLYATIGDSVISGQDTNFLAHDGLYFCSQYWEVKKTNVQHKMTVFSFVAQYIIIILSIYMFGTSNHIINVITIDNVYLAIIFLLKNYVSNNSGHIFQLSFLPKYIYYVLYIVFYYACSYFCYAEYVYTFLLIPHVMERITVHYKFQKLEQNIRLVFENFYYTMISKYVAKIIRTIALNNLKFNPNIMDDEFKPLIKKISVPLCLNFICSFIFASALHYFEKDGSTLYTMIIRQYYFRQYYFQNKDIKNNVSNEVYVRTVISDKNWVKLLDPYTLNCIIQLYMKSSDNNNIITTINNIKDAFTQSCEKIMTCWTIKTLFNCYCGISFNYIFILLEDKSINKLLITTLFGIITHFSTDYILILIMCEMCINPFVNKIIVELLYNLFKFIFKDILSIY